MSGDEHVQWHRASPLVDAAVAREGAAPSPYEFINSIHRSAALPPKKTAKHTHVQILQTFILNSHISVFAMFQTGSPEPASNVKGSNDLDEMNEDQYFEAYLELTRLVRGKCMYDGCDSIPDMIDRLKETMSWLGSLHRQGWKVEDTVCDDYATLVPNDLEERIAARLQPGHNVQDGTDQTHVKGTQTPSH